MGTITPIRRDTHDDGLTHDITPAYDAYTGPAIRLSWHNSVAVARANDPRCPAPWVLVPTTLLNRLAAVSYESGDRALAEEILTLTREAPMAGCDTDGECSLCGAYASPGSDICTGCIAAAIRPDPSVPVPRWPEPVGLGKSTETRLNPR